MFPSFILNNIEELLFQMSLFVHINACVSEVCAYIIVCICVCKLL